MERSGGLHGKGGTLNLTAAAEELDTRRQQVGLSHRTKRAAPPASTAGRCDARQDKKGAKKEIEEVSFGKNRCK